MKKEMRTIDVRSNEGWVKCNRTDIYQIERYSNEAVYIWVKLLCFASRTDISVLCNSSLRKFPPGTVVTSLGELGRSKSKSDIKRIKRVLNFLQKSGFVDVQKYREGHVIFVKNDPKIGEKIEKNADFDGSRNNTGPNTFSNLDGTLDECLTQPTEKEIPIEAALTEPLRLPHSTETPPGRNSGGVPIIIEGEKKRNNTYARSARRVPPYPPEFEQIYQEYPRREGKTQGFKVYQREIRSPALWNDLSRAISNYRQVKSGTDPKYLLHFKTFMNQWRDWLDINPDNERGGGESGGTSRECDFEFEFTDSTLQVGDST